MRSRSTPAISSARRGCRSWRFRASGSRPWPCPASGAVPSARRAFGAGPLGPRSRPARARSEVNRVGHSPVTLPGRRRAAQSARPARWPSKTACSTPRVRHAVTDPLDVGHPPVQLVVQAVDDVGTDNDHDPVDAVEAAPAPVRQVAEHHRCRARSPPRQRGRRAGRRFRRGRGRSRAGHGRRSRSPPRRGGTGPWCGRPGRLGARARRTSGGTPFRRSRRRGEPDRPLPAGRRRR